jgi:hypothetical protein
LDQIERAVAPVEGDAELIFSPPHHAASPVCMPISETQFETIRHIARVHELNAGPTIGEVDNGARDCRAVRKDFGVLQEPGSTDGSALMHGLACRWEARQSRARHARSIDGFNSLYKSKVNGAQIDATGKR